MATGNIDCNISDGMYNFGQPLNLNIFNSSDISGCDNRQSCLNMQPTIPTSISNTTFAESEAIEDLAAQLLNERAQHSAVDSNENCTDTQPVPSLPDSQPVTRHFAVDDNENSLSHGEFVKSISCPLLQVQKVMPEELFINVESDDEGVHSWRPNMYSDSLCHDFFMPPGLFHDDMDLNLPSSSQNQNKESVKMIQVGDGTSELQNSPLHLKPDSTYNQFSQPASSNLRIDIESHIRSQVAGLNIVRYEVINARRKVNELREEIQKMTHKLNEKLIVQRALDVGKLTVENAELRLECQCLCMEVDYYLKGKAPLGEIDEEFYRRRSHSDRETASQSQAQGSVPEPTSDIDDQADHKKWECHKCTFANHPAINSCEMCHTPRLNRDLPPYLAASSDSCYCHPKEDCS